MAEPVDLILPMLREMRAENLSEHQQTRSLLVELERRLGKVEEAQISDRHALTADTLLRKLFTGEFEDRIEKLEQKMREFEGRS